MHQCINNWRFLFLCGSLCTLNVCSICFCSHVVHYHPKITKSYVRYNYCYEWSDWRVNQHHQMSKYFLNEFNILCINKITECIAPLVPPPTTNDDMVMYQQQTLKQYIYCRNKQMAWMQIVKCLKISLCRRSLSLFNCSFPSNDYILCIHRISCSFWNAICFNCMTYQGKLSKYSMYTNCHMKM